MMQSCFIGSLFNCILLFIQKWIERWSYIYNLFISIVQFVCLHFDCNQHFLFFFARVLDVLVCFFACIFFFSYFVYLIVWHELYFLSFLTFQEASWPFELEFYSFRYEWNRLGVSVSQLQISWTLVWCFIFGFLWWICEWWNPLGMFICIIIHEIEYIQINAING